MAEYLLLKWGTVKGCNIESDEGREALQRWADGGVPLSAMARHDTDEQKQALCDLIDALDGDDIMNDWSGEKMSKDEAKKYVMEYGNR